MRQHLPTTTALSSTRHHTHPAPCLKNIQTEVGGTTHDHNKLHFNRLGFGVTEEEGFELHSTRPPSECDHLDDLSDCLSAESDGEDEQSPAEVPYKKHAAIPVQTDHDSKGTNAKMLTVNVTVLTRPRLLEILQAATAIGINLIALQETRHHEVPNAWAERLALQRGFRCH